MQIERETMIAAPVERVWALLTEAEHVGHVVLRRRRRDRPAAGRRDGDALGRARRRPRPDRRSRSAAPLLLPLGGDPRALGRGAGRGQLHARRVHARPPRATAPGCASSRAASTKLDGTDEQRREAFEGNTEGWEIQLGNVARATRSASPPDGGLRRAGRPHALARAQPVRRARRGDRHDAGRRAAGQPRGGDQAPRACSTARASSRRRARARGPLHGPPRAADRDRPAAQRDRRRVGRAAGRDQAPGREPSE